MKLNSVQRQQERYRVIYIFKILQGLVPNPGILSYSNLIRGRMVTIPKPNSICSNKATKMRDQSLWTHGGKLFNLLPANIRNCTESLDIFKKKLDHFLTDIPDHPCSPGLYPEPISQVSNKNSNSLVDWIRFLKIDGRRPLRTIERTADDSTSSLAT